LIAATPTSQQGPPSCSADSWRRGIRAVLPSCTRALRPSSMAASRCLQRNGPVSRCCTCLRATVLGRSLPSCGAATVVPLNGRTTCASWWTRAPTRSATSSTARLQPRASRTRSPSVGPSYTARALRDAAVSTVGTGRHAFAAWHGAASNPTTSAAAARRGDCWT
jgi:hypothetical protein